jgi:hypothetical protein
VTRTAPGRKAQQARRKARQALSAQALTALQSALAAEQAACYGYGVVGAHLNASRSQSRSADSDWVAHQRARDNLTALITAAGADPGPAPVAYQLPVHVQTPSGARSLAVTLEEKVARAYLGGAAGVGVAARNGCVSWPAGTGRQERGRRMTRAAAGAGRSLTQASGGSAACG